MPALPTSWTRRLFERTGLGTVWTGVSLLAIALAVFLIQEIVLGRFDALPDLDDMRLTIIHLVITAYLIAATVYCEQAREESFSSIRPLVDPGVADEVIRKSQRDWRVVAMAGLCGALLAMIIAVYLAPGPASFDPRDWSPENGWHRVLSLLIGLWSGRLFGLIVRESNRLSDLAAGLRQIDLLALDELAPFSRRGLANAFLVIGAVAAYALFLLDLAYLSMVGGLVTSSLGIGGVALLLPLRGVRKRIQAAKRDELRWCRERLRAARDGLSSGTASGGELQDLVAWEARVASINEWPVDASTFTRFALYLLIPLGSWAGGAIAERLLDSALG